MKYIQYVLIDSGCKAQAYSLQPFKSAKYNSKKLGQRKKNDKWRNNLLSESEEKNRSKFLETYFQYTSLK